MGQCKRCGGTYGAYDMMDGIYKNCLKPKDIAKKKTIESDT